MNAERFHWLPIAICAAVGTIGLTIRSVTVTIAKLVVILRVVKAAESSQLAGIFRAISVAFSPRHRDDDKSSPPPERNPSEHDPAISQGQDPEDGPDP